MKRIKSLLIATSILMATSPLFISCQEDAPELNYTMNVKAINDFTEVVETINNGSLKNEAAIAKLTSAIDQMNTDQKTKLQALIDVLTSANASLQTKLTAIESAMKAQTLSLESKIALLETAVKNQTIKQEELVGNLTTAIDDLQTGTENKLTEIKNAISSVNTTLDSKLALLEAAMKAQTLSLENKLDALTEAVEALPDYEHCFNLIQEAIEALPDYGDKISAIEAAIKAIPDYSNKFTAVTDALNALKTQVESLGTGQTSIATKIGETTTAINNLITAVKSGDADATAALEEISQKLDELKSAIGSGSGSGTGGEETEKPTAGMTPTAVDLGLSVLWADRNVGAAHPVHKGILFAWGETIGKTEYTLENYKYYNSSDGTYTDIGENISGTEYDAATAELGKPWRMPTLGEFKELLESCAVEKITYKDDELKINQYCIELTAKNGKTIILPMYSDFIIGSVDHYNYRSGTRVGAGNEDASVIRFLQNSSNYYTQNLKKYHGFPIRPVRDK